MPKQKKKKSSGPKKPRLACVVWITIAALGVLVLAYMMLAQLPLILYLGPPAIFSVIVTWEAHRKTLLQDQLFSKRMIVPTLLALGGFVVWWAIVFGCTAIWSAISDR